MTPGTEHEEQTQPAERLAADRWPRVRQEYRAVLQTTAHSRAARLFCAVLPMALGAATLSRIIIQLPHVFFQAGFFEELLFRGALMTRLSALLRADWGFALSSLAFGRFHIGAQTHQLGGDWLVGAASTIVNQAIFGRAVAMIFARTRNLLAPSIFHVILDTIGGLSERGVSLG